MAVDFSAFTDAMARIQQKMSKKLAAVPPEEAARQEQLYQREKAAREAREYQQAKQRIEAEKAKGDKIRAEWQLQQMKQNIADGLIPMRTDPGKPITREWFMREIMLDVPFMRFENLAIYGDNAVRIATQSYIEKRDRGVRFRNPISYVIACCERVQMGKHFTWEPEYVVAREGRWHDRVSIEELKSAIGVGLTIEDPDDERDLLTALPMAQKMAKTSADLSRHTDAGRDASS